MKGKFITFEGSEGSGKSTQIQLLKDYLIKNNKKILYVREPGGVKISEKIREILLDVNNKNMSDECECLLYIAARAQLVKEVIIPALKQGKVVLCDRFMDSTIAYQGFGNGVDISKIKTIGNFSTKGIKPDITFVFDIDIKKGFARINRKKDRIELRDFKYHDRVRRGYLTMAKKEPRRVKVIKVDKSIEEIHAIVKAHVNKLLGINSPKEVKK